MARITPEIHWNPPENLSVWRYSAHRHGSAVGDGFAAPSPSIGNYANFYGAEIARANPDRDVYIINISRGGTNLCQWFESAEPVNMWEAIVDNVAAALNDIPGTDYVDEIIWWGHESDAAVTANVSATQFRDDFLAIIDRIDSQNWIPADKPSVRLHKIHPKCNGLAEQINFGLELIAKSNTQRFLISDTTQFTYSDNIHLDPDQKEMAAKKVLTTPAIDIDGIQREWQANLLDGVKSWLVSREQPARYFNVYSFQHYFKRKSARQVDPTVEKIKLKSGDTLSCKVRSHGIAGRVVTISMRNVVNDLELKIDNQIATLTAGKGVRQASFRLRKTIEPSLLVSVTASENKKGMFSNMKLELGGAHTNDDAALKPDAVAGL